MSELALTAAETARFHDDGYLLRRALFDAEEAAFLKRAIAEDETIARNVVALLDEQGGATELALWNHPGDDLFGAVARSARVVDSMETLLGGEVYHYHSKLTMKAPHVGGAWNWHQDYGYWYQNGCLFPDLASVAIAIDPATRENGCLQVIRGSHLLGRIDHVRAGGQTTAEPDRVDEVLKRLDVVWCEMDPGDGLFFHCNLLHGSDQNRTERPRNILICCYNAARNDPYKAHHHPFYTPLEKLPDGEVKARGAVLAREGRRYYSGEDDQTVSVMKSELEGG
jgi:ectoine hydroxylase-related dioxygenase (phytanoyl-CoA dioxygenase family)